MPALSKGGTQVSKGLSKGVVPRVQEGGCKKVLLKVVCTCCGLGFCKLTPMPASLPPLLSLKSQSTYEALFNPIFRALLEENRTGNAKGKAFSGPIPAVRQTDLYLNLSAMQS